MVNTAEFQKLLDIYRECGIATYLDVLSIDSRAWTRNAIKALVEIEPDANMVQFTKPGGCKVARVIYDQTRYSRDEAMAHVYRYVFKV